MSAGTAALTVTLIAVCLITARLQSKYRAKCEALEAWRGINVAELETAYTAGYGHGYGNACRNPLSGLGDDPGDSFEIWINDETPF